MNIEKIFDEENVDDLCNETQVELKNAPLKYRYRKGTQAILSLFTMKSELTVKQIVIGLERVFSIVKKVDWVEKTIARLIKKNAIEKMQSGPVTNGATYNRYTLKNAENLSTSQGSENKTSQGSENTTTEGDNQNV